MNRAIPAVLVLGLALVATPLRGQNVPEPVVSAELPDAALPAELDRVLRDYERAWRAGDAVALASLFAEDGFVLQSHRPPVRGRRAIQAAYEGQGGGPLRLRALASVAGDTIGYIIGTYGYGDAPGDAGKFTLTLHREPGRPWLIFSDMDNQNAPPQHQRVSDVPSPTRPLTSGR
jgi:ketosteroid isomerase-like protein